MNDYLCLTLLAEPGETEAAFSARLAAFWTSLLRARPDVYARVYAEARAFASAAGRVSRQYMVEAGAADEVLAALGEHSVAYAPLDRDDTYTKYEAASPEWFQIPH